MSRLLSTAALLATLGVAPALARADPSCIDWQAVGSFSIARTETTVAQFRRYVDTTGTVTRAERQGGGEVYEAGWTKKPGWTWRTPFGAAQAAADAEPAVHVTFHEAQAFCRWAGGQLPSDAQWVEAAYTEQRAAPPAPWQRGRSCPYPTGEQPTGAQCLDDCGPEARGRAIVHGAALLRGHGHALVTATPTA